MKNIYLNEATRQRIPHMQHIGDLQFDLSGDEAVVQEDVPLIGNWSDWTGSGVIDSRIQQTLTGQENLLQGTDPQITDNAKLNNLNVRGIRKDTHRSRTIKKHVELTIN